MQKLACIMLALLIALSSVCTASSEAYLTNAAFRHAMAPFYSDPDLLCDAFDDAYLRGESLFSARLMYTSLIDTLRDHLNARGVSYSMTMTIREDGQSTVDVEMVIPLGTIVVQAYKSGNLRMLDKRGLAVLDKAQALLEELISEKMSPLARELAIHDYLTANVRYDITGDVGDAYSALCLGVAKCTGFSDAFYLLGTMAGLNVGKIGGMTDAGSHEWNTIELDGVTYFVDVTWNAPVGSSPTHIYFNLPTSAMAATHTWLAKNEPENMAREIDTKNYYFATGKVAMHEAAYGPAAVKSVENGLMLERISPISVSAHEAVQAAISAVGELAHVEKVGVSYTTVRLNDWQYIQIHFSVNS